MSSARKIASKARAAVRSARAAKEFRDTVLAKGGKVLGDYLDAKTPVQCICKNGHVWLPRPAKIANGQWCGLCVRGAQCAKPSFEVAKAKFLDVVASRGGKILGEYQGVFKTVLCECPMGHRWEPLPSNVCHHNAWCRACAGRDGAVNEAEFRKFVEQKGGRLAGDYKNESSNVLLECSKKHQWSATPSNVRRISWCPVCNISKGEQAVLDWLIAENILHTVQWRQPINGHTRKYDFIVPHLKLLIEYDGEPHFHQIAFFTQTASFDEKRQADNDKNAHAVSIEHHLLRIPYWRFKDIPEILAAAINQVRQALAGFLLAPPADYWISDPTMTPDEAASSG